MPNIPDENSIGALNRQPANLNFLQGVQFKFVIRKLPNTIYFVQKCNLPDIEAPSTKQFTPMQDLSMPGTTLNYGDLDIEYKINGDFSNYLEIFKWVNGENFPKDTDEYVDIKNENRDISAEFGGIYSDAILHVLDNKSQPIINILFRDAFPVKCGGFRFDTTDDGTNILTSTASFKYGWIDIERVT